MADQFGRWFLPGPSQVHPDVLAAMARPHPADAGSLLDGIRQPLKALFRTSREVMLVDASATGLMEAAIRNGVEERVLVVIGGSYGERFAQVAEACGKEVVRDGRVPNLDVIELGRQSREAVRALLARI